MMNRKVYAVVLVGGKGKRLRPLSTSAVPKAFLSITADKKTLFRRTLDRVRVFTPERDIMVVANRSHFKLVKKDFPRIARENLVLEPVSRNTAPAITLAAALLEERTPGATLVVLPTDQYITDEEGFPGPIRQGIKFIRKNPSAIVVLGVKPRYPSAHFGYIKVKGGGITKVKKFIEKPDRKKAEEYMESGDYLWNTGVFIFNADTLLRGVKKFAPRIYDAIVRAKNPLASYRRSPDISIDYALIEKFASVYCVKADYEWHDVGGFESLIKILSREGRGFKMRGGKVMSIV